MELYDGFSYGISSAPKTLYLVTRQDVMSGMITYQAYLNKDQLMGKFNLTLKVVDDLINKGQVIHLNHWLVCTEVP